MVPLNLSGHILYLSPRPGYYLGSNVSLKDCKDFVEDMKAREIGFVVVLMPEDEMAGFYGMNLCSYYKKMSLKSYHYPIHDKSAPTDQKSFHDLIVAIWSQLETGNVLIHCSGGVGRTGTVAAAVLIYGEGENPDDAIARVRHVRPRAVETQEQESFLKAYSSFVLATRKATADR